MPEKKKKAESNEDIIIPSEGELLCVVRKLLGGDHVVVYCLNGKEMKGRIAGKLRKRVWIKEGDVVLVSPWGFQDKCDVIHKYSDNEVDELVKKGVVSKDLIETLRR